MNNKIFIISHQKIDLSPSSQFPILYVGGNVLNEKADNIYFDNTGDNISKDNIIFNEMSGVYWAWKNYDELGNPDNIGFMHYRRLFIFKDSKYAYFSKDESSKDILNELNYSNEIYNGADFIVPTPYKRLSVQASYNIAHHDIDIPLVLDIIKELYPNDYEIAKTYVKGKAMYFNNMFIFKKEQFFEYCDWIFPILFKFKEVSQYKTDRLFISEILTGIFFKKLMAKGLTPKNFPILFIEDKKPSFKESI
ncbi:MAG: DUF4422 domain-containing protein, partial [Clostridia bacterium]|nr:DUF4422 domain-containing protein [Clostridia bacterium]